MTSQSDSFKVLKRKCDRSEALVDRISEQLHLRKKTRREVFERQRSSVSSGDIDDLIEMVDDVEMLDVSTKKTSFKHRWVELLWSEKLGDNLIAVEKASRLISWKPTQAIKDIIAMGLVPRLFELFNAQASSIRESYLLPTFRKTLAGILVNVSSLDLGSNVDAKSFVLLVELLDSEPAKEFQSDIILILGNIASESTYYRDVAIKSGVMSSLRRIIDTTINLRLLCNAIWSLSNMCFGRSPPPDFAECSLCIPTVVRLIPHEDNDVIVDACYAMGYLCHGSKSHIRNVITAGACPRLMELLHASQPREVILAALFVLSKLVLGTDDEVQEIIRCGSLVLLKNLLQSNDEIVVKETCSIIANIAAGNSNDIQAVIDSGAIRQLLNLIQCDNREIKLEAAIAIRQNISSHRTLPGQIAALVSNGCMKVLCNELSSQNDLEILAVILRALQTILDFDQDGYVKRFLKYCSIIFVESLMSNENPKVRKYSSKILLHLH